MTHALVTYYSHGGHTARIARIICETLRSEGATCDMMDMMEVVREGVVWEKYDLIIVGAAVIYGVYNKIVWEFVRRFEHQLETTPSSFFNVTVVARTPYKATIEGNRYMQRFLQKSPWHPADLKCFAGKVDYPNWTWYQKLAIQMIMKMTKGPTDPTTVIDYTDWDDVKAYARHCLTLVVPEKAPAQDSEKRSEKSIDVPSSEAKPPKKPRPAKTKTATDKKSATKRAKAPAKRKSAPKTPKKTSSKKVVTESEKATS